MKKIFLKSCLAAALLTSYSCYGAQKVPLLPKTKTPRELGAELKGADKNITRFAISNECNLDNPCADRVFLSDLLWEGDLDTGNANDKLNAEQIKLVQKAEKDSKPIKVPALRKGQIEFVNEALGESIDDEDLIERPKTANYESFYKSVLTKSGDNGSRDHGIDRVMGASEQQVNDALLAMKAKDCNNSKMELTKLDDNYARIAATIESCLEDGIAKLDNFRKEDKLKHALLIDDFRRGFAKGLGELASSDGAAKYADGEIASDGDKLTAAQLNELKAKRDDTAGGLQLTGQMVFDIAQKMGNAYLSYYDLSQLSAEAGPNTRVQRKRDLLSNIQATLLRYTNANTLPQNWQN